MTKKLSPPAPATLSFRAIPSVSDAVAHAMSAAKSPVSAASMTSVAQRTIDRARKEIALGLNLSTDEILQAVVDDICVLDRARLSPVLNATGILIHTNLGRAPVSPATTAAMASAASSYVSLELDPESNLRGGRMQELSDLMRVLTGAEATLVVNNNAAAVLLTLSALAGGREVIVSRGEAVEIGGGFRIPEVLGQSGAKLVEVGATNRTYAADYRNALSDRTAAILKVHQSNFRIEGFAAMPAIEELVAVASSASIPVIDDLGSGALLDVSDYALGHERTIQESAAAGVSIVTASGDKLMGGPQAGIICGDAALIKQIEGHPLARAVRADKTCLAGLAATLRHYLHGDAVQTIPVWRMIAAAESTLRQRAEAIRDRLPLPDDALTVVPSDATTGGGSLPGDMLPSWALSFRDTAETPAHELAKLFRNADPRVFGRVHEGQFLLDLRTVLPEDDERLLAVIGSVLSGG